MKKVLFAILALFCVSNASAQYGVAAGGRDIYISRHIRTGKETPEQIETWNRTDELGRGMFLLDETNRHRYSSALSPKEKMKKWGFANYQGKMVVKARYDSVEPFSEGLALVMKDGKYGFVNENGDLVVEMKYDDATSFFFNSCGKDYANRLSICRLGDCYGIINSDGTTYLDFNYSNIEKLNNLSCIATKVGSTEASVYVFLGSKATVHEFDKVSFFEDAIAIAEKNGKIMLVDIDGDTYEGMSFDEFEDFDPYGLAVVKKGNNYGLLQSDLEYKVPCNCPYYEFHQGMHLIGKSDESFRLFSGGREVTPSNCSETHLYPFANAIAFKISSGKYGVKTLDDTLCFYNAKKVECIDEDGTILSVSFDGCNMIWESLEDSITVDFGKARYTLPVGSKGCTFDGAIVRFTGKDGYEKYLTKSGKRLETFEFEAVEVRTLSSKYLAVCLADGKRKSKKMQMEDDLRKKYGIPDYSSYIGWPIWVVANAEGETITGDKQFVAIGEFDAKGNLPYQIIAPGSYQPKSGKMRFAGNKVTYTK